MKTNENRRERIARHQAELQAIELELMDCRSNIVSERQRHSVLARQYNNKIGFYGFLLDD